MRARDDLIASFCRAMPNRVAQATDLWLGFEQGEADTLPTLRRLLHTVKGEAHMLELESCSELAEQAESVVDALRRAGGATALTGDALLSAFEGMAMVTAPGDDPPDLTPVLVQLRAAIAELEGSVAQVLPATRGKTSEVTPSATAEAKPAPAQPAETSAVAVEAIGPLALEMRRLHGEQAVFHKRLRETQRMLRALLVEIDPQRSPEELAERITKTLGYGSEVDRRLSAIRAEWSSNDFLMGLALDELQDTVQRASVVGVDRLLNQAVRVARSTGRTLNKDVELRVTGDAILDAAVEQRLEPALLHLVRNAIDHGIEATELRRERGKPERGTIEVSITQTGSSVTVAINDDGGGVNFDRLRKVLAPRVPGVEKMSNEDLLPYLFDQGVSTSDQISVVSGRGVGLDVVAREIGAAGGQIRIESVPKMGTRVLLQLPSTLRGEVAVPVSSGKHRYAFPSRAVYSVTRLEKIEQTNDGSWLVLETPTGRKLVRVHSLAALLGGDAEPRIGEAVLVLHHASGLYAVSVEGYDNPRPVTVQRSEELAFKSALIRGVAPTPDGGVLLLLDVEALYASSRGQTTRPRSRSETARRQPLALVVEDAPVARELLCGILRSIGWRVEEATDGRQGLSLAEREPPDVILTDIEMPYMTGTEMLTELKRSPRLAQIPVIVLTTAANERGHQGFEELGVEFVLSKRRFVDAELKELVERCLRRN